MEPSEILNGNIKKCLVYLAIPSVISCFVDMLYGIVDTLWLGWSGTEALAASNLAAFPTWMMYGILGIVCTGVNSLLAQKLGEASLRPEAKREAESIVSWGISMSLLLGGILAVVAYFGGRQLLSYMAGSDSPLIELGYSYLGLLFIFAPIFGLSDVLMAILRAYGDTRTPMMVCLIGTGLNILLDPLLIFGWGPIPRLDVVGAAIGTNVSLLLALIWLVWRMGSGKLIYTLPRRSGEVWSWPLLGGIMRIGAPPALSSCAFSSVYMLLSPIVSSFGMAPVAAIGIGHKLEGLTYMICYGVAMACVTMVGQNVGAQKFERAQNVANISIRFAAWFSAGVAFVFWFVPHWLTMWFSSDADVLLEANNYIHIIALAQIFAGVCVLVDGIFAGAGKTWPSMCVSIPCALLRVPAAYFAVHYLGLGVSGVWMAISAMCIVRGLIMLILFLKGLWRDKAWRISAPASAT